MTSRTADALADEEYALDLAISLAWQGYTLPEIRRRVRDEVGEDASGWLVSTKHTPGGKDHDQTSHGSWSHGHTGKLPDGGRVVAAREFDNDSGYAWHDQHRDWAQGITEDDRRAFESYYGFGYGLYNRVLRGIDPPMTSEKRAATPEEIESWRNWMRTGAEGPSPAPEGWKWETGGLLPDTLVRPTIDRERLAKTERHINVLRDAFDRNAVTVDEDMQVLRAAYVPGMTTSDLKLSVGGVVTEKGFTSTSVGPANGRIDIYIAQARSESLYSRYSRDTGKPVPAHDPEGGEALKLKIDLPKGSKVIPIEAIRRYSGSYPNASERGESEILLRDGAQFLVKDVKLNAGVSKWANTSVPYHEVTLEYIPD